MEIQIRTARPKDAVELLGIYAPYVEKTAITFEYEVPTIEEFRARIENTLRKYPYLVAENAGGRILGYAYTGPFKGRAAYDWAVETSIYLAEDARGQGVGTRLYSALEDASRAQGILNMNACITYADEENEYLTHASPVFHEKMGYRLAGRFHQCGFKFGQWFDMIWMEKPIGDHNDHPKKVTRFSGV